MARAKKEAALTPEERLQAALVPDWEWPYKLPKNWCWTRHNSIMDIVGGAQPPKAFFIREPKEGYVQLYQTRDYGENPVPAYIPQKYATKTTDEGDILLARYGGSLGKVFRAHKGAYNVALAKVIILYPEAVDDEFLYLYYYSHFYQDFCIKAGYGRSAQAGFNKSDLNELLFPFPPLAEQQRIVDRIESLFAKLDEAKEKAQAVVDSFETRKAAILHKAFTGELTAKWREEHGLRMESWKKRHINEVARPRSGYAFDSKKFTNTGYQVIRMGNLYGETLDLFRKPVFILEDDVDDSILNRALIKDGDILITLTGTKYKRDYGYAVCVSSPNKLLVNQRILCLTPSACVKQNYLLYYLRSNLFRDVFFGCETGGVNQGNVSSKFVENIEIPIPTLDEQCEITTALDRTLVHEQQAKEAAEAVLDQVDLMKKSILARAFRGELGTNDPSEENAVELLKRVLREE